MKAKKLTFLILILSTFALFSSCSKTEQPKKVQTEPAQTEAVDASKENAADAAEAEITAENATIKRDENGIEYESDDGDTVFEVDLNGSADIPEDYPSDIVPIYPNGRVTLAGKEGTGYVVAIITDDSISDIFAYYKKNIVLDQIVGEQNSTEMAMIMGTAKGMSVSLTVTVNSIYDGGEHLIAISMGE